MHKREIDAYAHLVRNFERGLCAAIILFLLSTTWHYSQVTAEEAADILYQEHTKDNVCINKTKLDKYTSK